MIEHAPDNDHRRPCSLRLSGESARAHTHIVYLNTQHIRAYCNPPESDSVVVVVGRDCAEASDIAVMSVY